MANDNTLFVLERRYNEVVSAGRVISYILDERFKGGAVPVRAILDVVCVSVLNGDCQFYQIKYGPVNKPLRVFIDKTQYVALLAITNP